MMDAVAWSPCGRYLACGTWGKEIQLWAEHADTDADADAGTGAPVDSAAVPASRVVAADVGPAGEKQQQLEQQAAWRCVRRIAVGTFVHGLSWRRDSVQLASSGTDKAVRVWDVASGVCVAVLHGHTDVAHCVSWCGGGQQQLLASGSSDLTIRVWRREEAVGAGV
eukprot:XP_001698591.1 predicted protein [Chlamydomonas reinhardtii]